MARCRDEARPARHVPVVVPDPRGSDSPRTRRRNASGGGRDARVGFPASKGGQRHGRLRSARQAAAQQMQRGARQLFR
uniref:Uncharacterized protein n=1 Tax=Oryza glumipatula TaxID=40148 RepID=A0A0E0B441_9ORYZ